MTRLLYLCIGIAYLWVLFVAGCNAPPRSVQAPVWYGDQPVMPVPATERVVGPRLTSLLVVGVSKTVGPVEKVQAETAGPTASVSALTIQYQNGSIPYPSRSNSR